MSDSNVMLSMRSVISRTIGRATFAIFRFNPAVAWHELRLRMRTGRVFLALFAYVLLTSLGVAGPVWFIVWQQSHYGFNEPSTQLGRIGLHFLVYIELTLVFIAVPAYAASSIASERERETLEMLRATMLSPSDIVTGKLLSVLAMAAVLLFVTLPVAAWCLMLGGVSPGELLRMYLLMFATATWVACLGMVMSVHFARAIGAVMATYGTIVVATILTGVTTWALYIMLEKPSSPPKLGPLISLVMIAVPVALVSWLGVTLFRWLIAHAPIARRFARSRLAAGALTIVAFLALMTPMMPTANLLSKAAPTALLFVTPYGAAAGTLEESVSNELSWSTPTGSSAPASATHWQGSIWSRAMCLYLIAAASFWVLATWLYARRNRT